jgi:hypothetical protein
MIHQARGTGEVYSSDDYPAPWARARCSPGNFYDYRRACWPSSKRIVNYPAPQTCQRLPFIYQVANNFVMVPRLAHTVS